MPNLFLVRYPESPIRVTGKGKLTIGRSEKNSIVLNEPRVSRRHSHILWNKQTNTFVLVDLGSSNGTYLNGTKIPANEPCALSDWDKIRIASAVFTVRVVQNPAVIENEFNELRSRVELEATEIIKLSDLYQSYGQAALSGDLEHLCPVELFQMLEAGSKSGILTLKTDDVEGNFSIMDGQVATAEFGEKRGEDAVYDVLRCNSGTFAFMPQKIVNENPEIMINTTTLLMEGCRLLDEAEAGVSENFLGI